MRCKCLKKACAAFSEAFSTQREVKDECRSFSEIVCKFKHFLLRKVNIGNSRQSITLFFAKSAKSRKKTLHVLPMPDVPLFLTAHPRKPLLDASS